MNKFKVVLDELESGILKDNSDFNVVKRGLSNYLGFDVDELLVGNDAVVYGGAPRDCLAELPINDVDIMALPRSARLVSERLIEKGFEAIPFAKISIANLYLGIRVINEPWTLTKGNCIVQIIRPVIGMNDDPRHKLKSCLENVDLSCCGVAYIPNALYETYNGAISHCKRKVFLQLKDNAFYRADRIAHRMVKLLDRGWTECMGCGQKSNHEFCEFE